MKRKEREMKRKGRQPDTLSVIDIGAHSIRMEIAEPSPGGGMNVLETLSQPVPIGKDVFTKGRIKADKFILVAKILRDYRKVMADYSVSSCRAIATSAVREALNKDIFIDRMLKETGIRVEALDSSEEIRLIYLSMRNLLRGRLGNPKDSVIAMIGTGSSHVCLFEDGMLRKAESFRMGTIRIYEELGQPISKSAMVIDDIVDSIVELLLRSFPKLPGSLVAVGSAPRSLLKMAGRDGSDGVDAISRDDLERLSRTVERTPPDKLAGEYGMSDLDALGLLPCCEILSGLMKASGAGAVLIPETNTRDAIIEDMLRRKSEDDPFEPEIVSCAKFLGEKFCYDGKHAVAVSRYCLEIFDAMKSVHGLGRRDRLLLDVAATLHDAGQFLNNRQHHKHSHYLIRNSQIPGLSSNEMEIVAVVARYHRRGLPKTSHPEYIQLDSAERVKVLKLAAILRVADALDRSHNGKFGSLNLRFAEGRMIICPDAMTMDMASETMALRAKSDLFDETYGIKVEFQ